MLEPHVRLVGGVIVDFGGAFAGIDRPAHHRQAGRAARVTRRVHDRGGRERGDRRLAHRHHVRALAVGLRADVLEEFDQVIDIVVQIELPIRQRDQLGVCPVGDVDLAAFEHPLDRAAQQRGVVPAHRCHDQQLRSVRGQAGVGEALEIAEGLVDHGRLGDRISRPIDGNPAQPESRLAARLGGVGEHLEQVRRDLAPAHEPGGKALVGEQFRTDRGPCAGRVEQRALHFMSFVKHAMPLVIDRQCAPLRAMLQCGMS